MRKRFAIWLHVLVMINLLLVASGNDVKAASQAQVVSKLDTYVTQYNGKTATDAQLYMGIQCKGFANWVFKNIFGVYIGPYPESANYKISNPQAETVGIIEPGGLTEESAKALLQKGMPGDYIQVQRSIAKSGGKCGPHSMMILSVKSNGVEVLDCNSDGKNTIRTYLYTWSKFDYDNRAMSLYHAKEYDTSISESDPAPEPTSIDWTKDGRYPTPITAYPAAGSGKIAVYNASLSAYSLDSAYIAAGDKCTINVIYQNGYCNVTYPTNNGSRTEYAKISDFIIHSVTPYTYSPASNLKSYTRSDMSTSFGEVYTTDQCTVVGKSGNKLELIYPVSGGYKLGWVLVTEIVPSDFPTPLYGYNASPTERTTVYESVSTMGTYYGQIFVDDACTLNAVKVSENWIQVTYPVGSTTKTGYVYLDQFIPAETRLITFYSTTVTKQTTTYRKSDMATAYGYVSVGDQITVVGKAGNKLQILYPLDAGGYKIAWIYNTDVKKNLTDISVTGNPSKTCYIEGQKLETKGLAVTAQYDDGSTADVTGSCTLSGYSSTVGVQTVNVSYEGKQTAFTVTVESKSPTGIELVSEPAKTEYYVGETIDPAGMVVQAIYDNGTTEVIQDFDVQGDDDPTASEGKKEVPVSYVYNDVVKTTSFGITVVKPDIELSKSELKMKKRDVVSVQAVTRPAARAVTWKSSVPAVATVADGKITAVEDGTAVISASFLYQGISYEARMVVTVTSDPAVSESVTQPGDVNGDGKVNMKDYSLLQQYLNGWEVTIQEEMADVNGDGKVNMKDYSLLQQYLNGWKVELKHTPMDEDEKEQTVSYGKKVYGKSERGRDLECYYFEPESYTDTILLNFAIHGFEDEYNADGQVLVDTANSLIDYYSQHFDLLNDTRLLIIPCANPDGLYDGTTNNGFGRCNANGVDLNRDFDANYTSCSSSRNYTPYAFSASESRALRDLVSSEHPAVVIDFHGWLDYTIGNYELARIFDEEMGLAHYVDFTSTNAAGYFSNWAYQQGALGLLVEFTNSKTVPLDKLVNAVNRMLNGDYVISKKDAGFSQFEGIQCYTLSSGRVTTYRYFDEPFSSASYIDGAVDQVTILGIYENGWAKVQYPISSGYKVAFVPVNQLIPEEYAVEQMYQLAVKENTTTYRRSDLTEQYGAIYPADACYVIADTGTELQVIYELDAGGWKMAWIKRTKD